MNIAYQLAKIGVFITDDGLVAVMKNMTNARMPPVVPDGIAGK
jgi:hypothetical protein